MHIPAVSPLVLTITYWLHMLATVVWIGSLAAMSLFVLPAARKALDANGYHLLLAQLVTRLQPVGWFSLAVLSLTGLFQMSASPNYQGFLTISNNWSVAILSKHITVGVMVLVSAYITWGLLPAIQHSALRRLAGRLEDAAGEQRLQARELWMLRLNLALSVVVLLLTAWARSS